MADGLLPLTLFTTWLARGERGLSSEAIVATVTGERVGRHDGRDHPWDAGDFNRCVKLIDHEPLVGLVFKDKMRQVSPEWAALVDEWDELTALLKAELEANPHRAPRTSARISELLDSVREGNRDEH